MSVSKLIQIFSTRTIVPVDIDAVVSEMKRLGVQDDIYYFHDLDLDTKTLSGQILREEIPWGAGSTRFHTTITYAKLGDEMERLVCCKELLHILDPDHAKTNTKERIENLLGKLSLPSALVDPFNTGVAENVDRIAIAESLAILFPFAARERFLRQVDAGKTTIRQIADRMELPEPHAAFVMSEMWPQHHTILVANRHVVESGPQS